MTNYDVIETLINYNKEYNHDCCYSPKELDEVDKKVMNRTRNGLLHVVWAIDDFYQKNKDILTEQEAIGWREVSSNIRDGLYKAIEEIDNDCEDRGFLAKNK